jgi:hypothetical protein
MMFALNVAAQHNPGYISLNAGPSFPVGGFRAKELPDGGFAMTGLNFTLEGAWFFKPWIGAGGTAGMTLHPIDVGALGYEKMNSDPFITNLTIRSDPFLSLNMYAGLFFQYPLGKGFSVTAKSLGGIIYAQTPYQLYKAEYYMIGEKWHEVTSAGDFEGSFLAGVGFRYDLKGCIGFSMQSDFTYNVMDFTFITNGGNERTDEKVISIVNLTGGLVIMIGK